MKNNAIWTWRQHQKSDWPKSDVSPVVGTLDSTIQLLRQTLQGRRQSGRGRTLPKSNLGYHFQQHREGCCLLFGGASPRHRLTAMQPQDAVPDLSRVSSADSAISSPRVRTMAIRPTARGPAFPGARLYLESSVARHQTRLRAVVALRTCRVVASSW